MTDPVPFPLPSKNQSVLEFLKSRRSNMSKAMGEPGPTQEQLREILEIAARVPDHRKLAPWRFIIFQGESRRKIGAHLGSVFQKHNPNLPIDRIIFESERFLRAPLVIGVVFSPVDCTRGTPEWEQTLSSGVVCYNLCLAAQADGFGAQWLTEWYAYDTDIKREMGLSDIEKIAGFIYIGTPLEPSLPRPRPDIDAKLQEYL